MSKVQLAGNANGTGIFTIASPNSNTDRTINLPDATGTVQVSGNPISGTTGTFTGLLNISAAGAGQIQFPAAQNASSNANTLDDYEEGTWTPTLVSAGGTVYRTSGTVCSYIKIGKQVTLLGQADFSNVSGAAGGNQIYIGNFPFAMGGDSGQSSMDCPIFIWNYSYQNWQNNYYFSSSASVGDTKHPLFWHGQAGAIATSGNDMGGGTVYYNFQYTYLASN